MITAYLTSIVQRAFSLFRSRSLTPFALFVLFCGQLAAAAEPTTISLDGPAWRVAVDPQNVGRAGQWWTAPRLDARPTRVPGILQGEFPGYHGVAWYWREFTAPRNPHSGGRYVLRFGAVDYLADVWLNGRAVGGHEGGETSFELDVTAAIQPNRVNRLAVRVLNPTNEPIDGIALAQTARRCKVIPFGAGATFNHGGIVAAVQLLLVPEVRLTDLHVVGHAEPGTVPGRIDLEATVHNASSQPRRGTLEASVADAAGGSMLIGGSHQGEFPPGESQHRLVLNLTQPRLWQINDPALYRATCRVQIDTTQPAAAFDERSTRFGFRDFRFADGAFRLNGRRVYLRSTHTCNHFPIGQQLPADPDLVRRDLLNLKAMGFNAVRFIWGGAMPEQLDYCDEIGLMVYQESFASAPIADCPQMAARFDANVSELIRRDRNHPSVVIWGLLNEAPDGPAFRHAVDMLPLVRRLDTTRMVLLNSGRYDNVGSSPIGAVAGLKIWPKESPTEPWVAVNATRDTITALGITWPAGQLALHPGPNGEYSVVRWTAPAASQIAIDAVFFGIAERATTDVHVLHNGRPLFDGVLNLAGQPNRVRFAKTVGVAAGDTLDAVVGWGNNHFGADSTALDFRLRVPGGRRFDATAEFSLNSNPNGVWTYGRMLPGERPKADTFAAHPVPSSGTLIGSLCNPGSARWEDTISDRHVYPRVPHTAEIVDSLRTLHGGSRPVFLSEYGIGSAVDLWRAVRHYEQRGATQLEDAQFFQAKLAQFLADYRRWKMDEAFPRPEDFFQESLRKMAGQRTLGLNAIRSNANIVGHSLTGAIDHVWCGEGLTTLFRELKPGTIDAMFDAWAPLRWCLFAEPAHAYRGGKVRLEAVLANEDALRPGEYRVRLVVTGPNHFKAMDKIVRLTVPGRRTGATGTGATGTGATGSASAVLPVAVRTAALAEPVAPTARAPAEPPLAIRCFDESLPITGPEGRYQFTATILEGGAAAGTAAEFYLTDAAAMPKVDTTVVLWGDDPGLTKWLDEHGIRHRAYRTGAATREVILAAGVPAGVDKAAAFADLARSVARGSTAIFLNPAVFAEGNQPQRWLPLAEKGQLTPIQGWLYLKDEWAKRHPHFDGLPAGGLMDYGYYREIIPDLVHTSGEPPAEAVAGAIKASQDYASGLMLGVYRLGAGRWVLNTLRIREELGHHPAAERLLRNLLRDAATHCQSPPADLPAGFDAQLRAFGYERR